MAAQAAQLIGRECLQRVSASQDQRRRKVEHLSHGEKGSAHESKEHGSKPRFLLTGLSNTYRTRVKPSVTEGFYKVGQEAEAEQRVRGNDVLGCRGGVR